MIDKIVNDKKSLELMMKYATAQSKSKKTSEIFENFYKIAQEKLGVDFYNENDYVVRIVSNKELSENEKFLAVKRFIHSNEFTEKVKRFITMNLDTFMDKAKKYLLELKIPGTVRGFEIPKNIEQSEVVSKTIEFIETDEFVKAVIDKINKLPKKYDFNFESFLTGTFQNATLQIAYEMVKELSKRSELPENYETLFEDPSVSEDALIEKISNEMNFDVSEALDEFASFIQTFDNIKQTAIKNKNYYKLYLLEEFLEPKKEILLDNFQNLERETADLPRDEKVRAKINFYSEVNQFGNEMKKLLSRDEFPVSTKSSALSEEAMYPTTIGNAENNAKKIMDNIGLKGIVDSIVRHPHYVLPSGFNDAIQFSIDQFGDESYLQKFLLAFLEGIIFEENFYYMHTSTSAPEPYYGYINARIQGGAPGLSVPRFSAHMMKKYNHELAQKQHAKNPEISVENFENFYNQETKKHFGLQDVLGQDIEPTKIRSNINDTMYNHAGQMTLVGTMHQEELKAIKEVLMEQGKDELAALSEAESLLRGNPQLLIQDLELFVNEAMTEEEKENRAKVSLTQRQQKFIEKNPGILGKNFADILRENLQLAPEEINKIEQKIGNNLQSRLFPDGQAVIPFVEPTQNIVKDETGKKVPMLDDDGEPLLDAAGNIMYEYVPSDKDLSARHISNLKYDYYINQPASILESFLRKLEFNNPEVVAEKLIEQSPDFITLDKLIDQILQTTDEKGNLYYNFTGKLKPAKISKTVEQMKAKMKDIFEKDKPRWKKDETKVAPKEVLTSEQLQRIFTQYISDFIKNYKQVTKSRFKRPFGYRFPVRQHEQRSLKSKVKDPGFSKIPAEQNPRTNEYVRMSEDFVRLIKEIYQSSEYPRRKYEKEQLRKEKLKKQSTQNLQRKVVSSTLQEMINKYASKR
jgi:hypothetical protein